MGLFGEDSPIEIFERNLMDAVKNGNTGAIKTLLEIQVDIPAAVFNKALEKAVKEDKVKTVETLLGNRENLWKVDPYALRTVIYNGNKTMFMALHKGGFSFDDPTTFYSGSTGEGDRMVRLQVSLWKKEIAHEAVVEELQALKHEITAKGGTLPDIKKAETASKKKDNNSFTM